MRLLHKVLKADQWQLSFSTDRFKHISRFLIEVAVLAKAAFRPENTAASILKTLSRLYGIANSLHVMLYLHIEQFQRDFSHL